MKRGQADTAARKREICKRSYDVLVNEIGFPAEDIIFDPNVFAVATGIEEHNNYAVDFIGSNRLDLTKLTTCHDFWWCVERIDSLSGAMNLFVRPFTLYSFTMPSNKA